MHAATHPTNQLQRLSHNNLLPQTSSQRMPYRGPSPCSMPPHNRQVGPEWLPRWLAPQSSQLRSATGSQSSLTSVPPSQSAAPAGGLGSKSGSTVNGGYGDSLPGVLPPPPPLPLLLLRPGLLLPVTAGGHVTPPPPPRNLLLPLPKPSSALSGACCCACCSSSSRCCSCGGGSSRAGCGGSPPSY